MLETGEEYNSILWLAVVIVSLIPLIAVLVSYGRIRSRRLLVTALAFILFTGKALILAMKLFVPDYNDEVWWSVAAILDIAIISLISTALIGKVSDS